MKYENVAIVTDGGASLTPEVLKQYDTSRLSEISFHIQLEMTGTSIDDVPNPSASDLAEFVRQNREAKTQTAQPSPGEFAQLFAKLFNSGFDRIVTICMSSKLSGTFNAACLAASGFEPNRVLVVDSMTTSMTQGLVVLEMIDMANASWPADKIAERAHRLCQRSKVVQIFSDLRHLQKGGRIGKAARFAGSLMQVKAVISLIGPEGPENEIGTLQPIAKARGWSRARSETIVCLKDFAKNQPCKLAFAHNGAEEQLALLFKEAMQAKFNMVSPPFITTQRMVLCVHSGDDAIGIGALLLD